MKYFEGTYLTAQHKHIANMQSDLKCESRMRQYVKAVSSRQKHLLPIKLSSMVIFSPSFKQQVQNMLHKIDACMSFVIWIIRVIWVAFCLGQVGAITSNLCEPCLTF